MLRQRRELDVVQHYWKALGSYSTVGLELALSIILGLAIGDWLDGRFGTTPWMTLIWVGFGLAAGVRAVYRALQRANREAEAEAAKERDAAKQYHDERNN